MSNSPFEKVFDDVDQVLDDTDDTDQVVAVTYFGTISREPETGGRRADTRWTVTFHDLPDNHVVTVTAPTYAQAERDAGAALTQALQPEDPRTICLSLSPAHPKAAAVLSGVYHARIARAEAEQAERDALTYAARTLTEMGWSTADAGRALRLSKARISQLAPRSDSDA